MPPKKGKKMNLNEFLGDSTLGSWADEMDALPSAPAVRSDDDPGSRFGRGGGGRDDYLSSRPDRPMPPPREDLPLPTSPPYTAFIGNLSFTVTELEMERHFGSAKIKTVKIIRGPDDRPKGFGYIEFTDLEGLKQGIAQSGTELAGRAIRVSVADPPKERSGGGGFEDSKFDSPWRRDGPLPPLAGRDQPRRRNDSNVSDRPPSVSETNTDWRASARARAPQPPAESEPSFRKKEVGFGGASAGAADREDVWVRGANFKPSDEPPAGRFGSGFKSREPVKDVADDEGDWRSRKQSTSPTTSNPPTPQMGRRKLDLLPRSNSTSTSTSPLSSPKLAPAQPATRSNPFGAARPVDVTSREREVAERVEKDREAYKERATHPMSRNTSRQGTERSPLARTPSTGSERPVASATSSPTPAAERPKVSTAPNVSPGISFANMAARKDAAAKDE